MATDRQRAWNEQGRRLQQFKPPVLTAEQRTAIRRRLDGGERAQALAVEFGVSRSTILRCR